MDENRDQHPEHDDDPWRPPAGEGTPPHAGSPQSWSPTNPYPWGGPQEQGGQPGEPGQLEQPAQPGQTNGSRPGWSRRGTAVLAGVALGAGLLGGGVGTAVTYNLANNSTSFVTAKSDSNTSSASTGQAGSVQQVANQVLPSVVSISIATPQGQGTGSGVILSSDGMILTNNHVVAPATAGGEISVTFNDGKEQSARVVGRDPATDLAVIQVQNANGLHPAVLGHSSDLKVGQEVIAIGSPLGLSGTVTTGIVSAQHRPVRVGGETAAADRSTVIDAVQTDAAINPGNSGGPLVNMNGEVIGINTAIASPGGMESGSIGLGFAIPIDQARSVAKQLTETGTVAHAQLGVRITDVRSSEQPGSEGAGVVRVQPGSAAAAGGLRSGDVVVKVENRPIDSADALIAAVRSHRPGDKITLTYVRDGSEHTTTVRLGSDAQAT